MKSQQFVFAADLRAHERQEVPPDRAGPVLRHRVHLLQGEEAEEREGDALAPGSFV